jgi:hypothetical protein
MRHTGIPEFIESLTNLVNRIWKRLVGNRN